MEEFAERYPLEREEIRAAAENRAAEIVSGLLSRDNPFLCCVHPAEEAAARRARLEDIPMCRYSHPIPTATCTEESEVACLLQWQNGLLCELLGTVNALLALGLGRPPQDPPSCP